MALWLANQPLLLASKSASRRALLTAGESFAPNGYVLTVDTRKEVMLVHELELGDEQ